MRVSSRICIVCLPSLRWCHQIDRQRRHCNHRGQLLLLLDGTAPARYGMSKCDNLLYACHLTVLIECSQKHPIRVAVIEAHRWPDTPAAPLLNSSPGLQAILRPMLIVLFQMLLYQVHCKHKLPSISFIIEKAQFQGFKLIVMTMRHFMRTQPLPAVCLAFFGRNSVYQ